MDTAISVKNLSKSFRMYPSPKERLKEMLHPFGKKYHQEFWALRGVSFEVKKGETLGIVGRNGSGKSTLLQLLCGILKPTGGEAAANGRVAALLELGAGFNPQFTGRENVYMNGAIMGLSKKEVDARYADIAAFADIGDFIDQPVKTYSSGMSVRLAFACTVNADPDIMIVDEALAVGDEAFQRKCFSRLHDIRKRGVTVLFVSHTASTVVELCERAILLDRGELLLIGPPKAVISKYHKLLYAPQHKVDSIREEIRGVVEEEAEGEARGKGSIRDLTPMKVQRKKPEEHGPSAYYDPNLKPKSTVTYESRGALIKDPRITTLDGKAVNALIHGEEYIFTYSVYFEEPAHSVRLGMMLKTKTGLELGGMASHPITDAIEYVEKGAVLSPRFTFRCSLAPGAYFLNAGLMGTVDGTLTYLHRLVDAVMIRVQPEKNLRMTGLVDFSSRPAVVVKGEVDRKGKSA